MVGLQGRVALLVALASAARHEVWVAVEDRLEVVKEPGGPRAALPAIPAKHIIGLSRPALRPGSGPAVYATALDLQGPSVYRIDRTSHLLLARGNESNSSYFEDISLDPTDSTLYLTSKSSRQILAVSAELPGASPRQVLDTGDKEPSGIAVDPCTRRIYWTNSARRRPSIEVCLAAPTLACSTLVAGGLTKPRAIAIDPAARRLFWSDLRRGTYSIQASWLDGTGRVTLASGQQREPFGLAALGPHLYWTDWTTRSVWRVPTAGTEEPKLVTSFPGSRPHGIAILPAGPALCSTTLLSLDTEGTTVPTVEVPPEVTTVGPVVEETEGVCQQHCLAGGTCSLTSDGRPVCSCPEGRAGPRCEQDLCTNYCLEGGACLVLEGAPECLCSAGRSGDRCQLAALPPPDPALLPFSRQALALTAIGLAAAAAALGLAVAGLAVTVARLRRRPRIVRKRFISVPKAETAGGFDGPASAGDGITLDIENCCNMTLCDTPCFEPPTRGPGRSKGRGRERMDRRSLLARQDDDCPDF